MSCLERENQDMMKGDNTQGMGKLHRQDSRGSADVQVHSRTSAFRARDAPHRAEMWLFRDYFLR